MQNSKLRYSTFSRTQSVVNLFVKLISQGTFRHVWRINRSHDIAFMASPLIAWRLTRRSPSKHFKWPQRIDPRGVGLKFIATSFLSCSTVSVPILFRSFGGIEAHVTEKKESKKLARIESLSDHQVVSLELTFSSAAGRQLVEKPRSSSSHK